MVFTVSVLFSADERSEEKTCFPCQLLLEFNRCLFLNSVGSSTVLCSFCQNCGSCFPLELLLNATACLLKLPSTSPPVVYVSYLLSFGGIKRRHFISESINSEGARYRNPRQNHDLSMKNDSTAPSPQVAVDEEGFPEADVLRHTTGSLGGGT